MAVAGDQDLQTLLETLQSMQETRRTLTERLRAIEERKGTTPPAVYEKVRRETMEKIAEVEAEAARYAPTVARAQQDIVASQEKLAAELGGLTEQLEELRFRNSLGEFGPGQFQAAEVGKLQELDAAEARGKPLRDLAELLKSFLSAPAPVAPPPLSAPVASARPAPPVAMAPPPVAPPPAPRSEANEMEALFGSPIGARPVPVPPPPARVATAPFPGPAPVAKLTSEETTQDLGIRAPGLARSKPGFPEASAPFRPVLIIKTKDRDRGEDTYDLASGRTLIGRAPENDIILLEESVSRRHARIVVENSECTYEDLGSANGSFINGDRLRPNQPRKLQDNDVVKMGQLLGLYRVSQED